MTHNLPWHEQTTPLMLAPMQGVTNRALRSLFIDWVRPDVVFTEFLRVGSGSKRPLSSADRKEISGHRGEVPLVVQLIGRDPKALVVTAERVQDCGVAHINLNMGCPFGRMTSKAAGGGLLKDPAGAADLLESLRRVVRGSLSVKLRAGYDDPQQVFSLLPLFEGVGIDFLILHPRTVRQRFAGRADHSVTGRVVSRTSLPVIANGDITTAAGGREVLEHSAAAGLMLGRGAIADPLLFARLRSPAAPEPSHRERAATLRYYLGVLLRDYSAIFCGEMQVLSKLKGVLACIVDDDFKKHVKKMKRCRKLGQFAELVAEIDENVCNPMAKET
jgi:tRNA-dihydrouridine synthase B